MLKLLSVFALGLALMRAVAADDLNLADIPDFVSVDQILTRSADDTACATAVFARALADNADVVSEDLPGPDMEQWARAVFALPDVLRAVLSCPEITGAADTQTIVFMPIEYTFPGGRKLVINYSTQPRVLAQRLSLATKRGGPGNNPNPSIGGIDDDAIWVNTDPAWYGIMVVESGALSDFVGPDKNNTVSMSYIDENIARLYPSGFTCTSKSALANDNDAINLAVRAAVGIEAAGEEDSNDYYVAGDINLEWISYTEMGLDLLLTVASYGGWAYVSGATKATRAAKNVRNLAKTMKDLAKLEKVKDYIRATQNYTRAAEELAKIDRVADAAKYAEKAKELDNLRDTMRELETVEDVQKYRQASDAFTEVQAYQRILRGRRLGNTAKRGNILTRGWRMLKAANSGTKMLNRGEKIARSGMKSGRVRDWLFHSTMRNAGKLARVEEMGGLAYGVWKFTLDMYDYTSDSTDSYTNGINFKPLLLLSADDIPGQENVVNYGMWLMWAGDSISAADDDAAYLQAMDFASKFHEDLMEVQNNTASPCSVDIYVVRPIIRNPGDADQELYYLIMNDTPWTTAQ